MAAPGSVSVSEKWNLANAQADSFLAVLLPSTNLKTLEGGAGMGTKLQEMRAKLGYKHSFACCTLQVNKQRYRLTLSQRRQGSQGPESF